MLAAYINKHNTLNPQLNHQYRSIILHVYSRYRRCSGYRKGHTQGHVRGGRSGRGHGISGQVYNLYKTARNYDPNSVVEENIYDYCVYKYFTREHRREMINIKVSNGWIDFHIEQQVGKAVPSMNMISSIQVHIHKLVMTGGANGTQLVTLPPYTSGTHYPVPFIVNNNPSTSGKCFVTDRYFNVPAPRDSSVASVQINGIEYYIL